MNRWKKLNANQLLGAHYGLRVFRTWTGLNKPQVAMLDKLLIGIADEHRRRERKSKKAKA